MPEEQFIHTVNDLKPSEDYNFLRREGIRLIQLLSGNVWTDYNAHDPGVTLLEALCYTLTDLGYRTSFDIKDLIAPEEDEKDWKGVFHTTREILPCNPVTTTDFRKLIIDVDGVKNAWVEPSSDYEHLMFLNTLPAAPGSDTPSVELSFEEGEPIRLKGLYKITVDYEEEIIAENRQQQVDEVIRKKLNMHRNLCEDFLSLRPVEYELFTMEAEVQVFEGSDIEKINAKIYQVIHNFFSPAIQFYTWQQMEEKGYSAEEILEGPLLKHGFIDTTELERSERYMDIHLSDIISLIIDIPGVIAVKKCTFPIETQSAFSDFTQWITNIKEKEKAPRLDIDNSTVNFIRSGDRHRSDQDKQPDKERVKAIFNFLQSERPAPKAKGSIEEITMPRGEFMNVADYYPFQYSLPSCYGLQEQVVDRSVEMSIIESAAHRTQVLQSIAAQAYGKPLDALNEEERTRVGKEFTLSSLPDKSKQVLQLRGFLMVFEQIMADYLSQLNHLPDLFSFDPSKTQTYFPQPLQGIYDSEALFVSVRKYHDQLQKLMETDSVYLKRRNAILDHLLARVGQDWGTYNFATASTEEYKQRTAIANKCRFLMNYSQVSSYRGTGYDYSNADQTWNTSNIAGMKKRICMLLDLKEEGTTTIAKDWISVEPSNRPDRLAMLKVVLRDPDSNQTLLESNDYEQDEVNKILNYILAFGFDRTLYDLDKRRDNYAYKLKDTNPEGANQFVAFHNESNWEVLNSSFEKALDTLKQLAYSENFHVLEHILLRPRINPQVSGNQQMPNSLLNITETPPENYSGSQPGKAAPYNFRMDKVPDPADPNNWVLRLSLRQGRYNVIICEEDFHHQEHIRKRVERLRKVGTDSRKYRRQKNADNRFEFSIIDDQKELAVSAESYQKAEDMEKLIKSLINYFSYDLKLIGEEDADALNFASYADPYSFRVSLFVPAWPEKFRDPRFRHLFERAVYMETPAHVYPDVYWLSYGEMKDFEVVYKSWLEETAANAIPDNDITSNLIDMVNKIRRMYHA